MSAHLGSQLCRRSTDTSLLPKLKQLLQVEIGPCDMLSPQERHAQHTDLGSNIVTCFLSAATKQKEAQRECK